MIRYHITLGATTTAGGKVVSAASTRSINGAALALMGDAVVCPACKSDGVIAPDGPRLDERFDGRQFALSDDLCRCKCLPPPRLVASQTFSSQVVDGEWLVARTAAAVKTVAELNASGTRAGAEPDGIPLVLLDPDSGKPHAHRPYRVELRNGVIEGTTDHDGATRPLTATERAAFIRWRVEHDNGAI